MKILFWVSLSLLVYVYAGFPALVVIFGWLKKRDVRKQSFTPKISMIIAAYNEQDSIAEKLDNLLNIDYPDEALEIIVASDGCEDATESIVLKYAAKGILLLCLPRRGKIYALNDAVASATGEILVFSDATSILEKQALRKLVRNFADPQVGGVSGCMVYTRPENSDSSSQGENLYWLYERWLKKMESRTGSIISATGALFAIRREHYHPPTDAAVTDDFAISTAVIEQGRRLVFDSEALVFEEPAPVASGEFARKVRMMTRGLRSVILRKNLLNPFNYGFYAIAFFSHKILRRLMPECLVLLLVSSFFLKGHANFYMTVFVGQIFFYAFATIGYLLRKNGLGRSKIFYIPFFYCLANAAALIAVIKVLSGKRIELWQPQR
jgi:cellulose synthase/poly-beta-1,6-N-acetylglucosamine synthase-like glycosyltransferase